MNVDRGGSELPEQREPTHVFRVEVPLWLDGPPLNYDAVAQAMQLALAVSRAGFDGVICNDINVTMEER